MKLTLLTLLICGLAIFLLSVRVIFSKSHSFLAHRHGTARPAKASDNKTESIPSE